MSSPLSAIRSIVSRLKLDKSLLFLNYLLGVSRGEYQDNELAQTISASPVPPMAFLVHFFAKQLLQNASVLGIETLDWRVFRRLMDLYLELGDPIIDDPTLLQSDSTGFFERIMGAQLPAQRQIRIQDIGIALGLF